ncbi:MAG TPA: hypothetical protein VFA50_05210 [Stellaceae bacterium]|nr:hypothetical protein [Stellaceae bacterium]
MISKRVGNWSWALSPDERLAAAIVDIAQREKTHVAAATRRRYRAMLEKQKKLLLRGTAGGAAAPGHSHGRFAI